MIRRVALVMCLSLPVFAADVPIGSNLDGRVQYTNFKGGDVYNLYVQDGISTWVVLEAGETITAVSTGFPEGYFIDADGQVLTVKPMAGTSGDQTVKPVPDQWRTNIAVRTDKNRFYNFDVQLIPTTHKDVERVAHRVEFRYPTEALAAARLQAEREQAAVVRDTPVAVVPKHVHYEMRVGKKSNAIKPVRMMDDGAMTYITFRGEIPQVFMVSADGETLVNAHTDRNDPQTLVVHRVAQTFVLRLGRAVVSLHKVKN